MLFIVFLCYDQERHFDKAGTWRVINSYATISGSIFVSRARRYKEVLWYYMNFGK